MFFVYFGLSNKFFSFKNRKLFLETENKGKKQLLNIPLAFTISKTNFIIYNTSLYNIPSIKTSIFFNIPFKYSFFIIFYSFFSFLSPLSLSLSQPNYSQHRQPSHPPTHTTSTHHHRHRPLTKSTATTNNNRERERDSTSTHHHIHIHCRTKKNQQQSNQITTNHSKKKRKDTHKPHPNRTTTHNQKKPTNQIGP